MTLSAREDPLVREMQVLVDALAGGTMAPCPPAAWGAAEWSRWFVLVEAHGLAPGFSRLLEGARWSTLPPELKVHCRTQHLAQTARSLGAFRQFQEIRSLLDLAGIPLIPLKGLAFDRTLYPDPGSRHFGDLDLLVPEAAGHEAVSLLKQRGYRPLPSFTSAEEEYLHGQRAHFCPLVRPGGLPVEIHTQVLKDRGKARQARDDAWALAAPDGEGILQLDRTHTVVLAAAHYATHLRLGVGHLKWMVDLLLLLRRDPTAEALTAHRETAERWDLEETVSPVLAAAARWGEISAAELSGEARLPADALVYSPIRGEERVFASARSRLASLAELPGPAARARYLFGLLFPSPAHLRYRYGVPEGRTVLAHRLAHPLRLARRLMVGARKHRSIQLPTRMRSSRMKDAG